MTIADLRPEQRDFAERVLYSVGRNPEDPIYSGLIAEVVAIYDQHKDRLLEMCENQKPNQVLLFRGPELYRRMSGPGDSWMYGKPGDVEIFVRHREIPRMVPIPDDLDTGSLVQRSFAEKFMLYGQSCKCCGALHYYSQNWQEAPEWLRQDDFERRFGYQARENQEYLDRIRLGRSSQ